MGKGSIGVIIGWNWNIVSGPFENVLQIFPIEEKASWRAEVPFTGHYSTQRESGGTYGLILCLGYVRFQYQNENQSKYLFCLISAWLQTEILIVTQFMQMTPYQEYTHQYKVAENLEQSKGVALATSPDFSYLVHLFPGIAFSSVNWMKEEHIIQRAKGHREHELLFCLAQSVLWRVKRTAEHMLDDLYL